MTVQDRIKQLVEENKVVLFMKGTRTFPQCGFSARAVEIFKQCGVQFKDVNVLADPDIRQGIKDFSNWPTIPQAYVDGQFVGGSDILLEMYENGELQGLLGVQRAEEKPAAAPKLVVTAAAQKAFEAAMKDAGGDVLRFDASPSFEYDLYFGPKQDRDFAVDAGGLTVHVAPGSAARIDGTTIDFVDGPEGAGFRIDNPNEPPRVKPMSPTELASLRKAGEAIHLFDVRGDRERALATIEGDVALDDAGQQKLADLSKDARIVLYCHHGIRSRTAAEELLSRGYTNVYNLVGGIDAYSAIDPSVPRY
jgi:monothiol glutaredoxin